MPKLQGKTVVITGGSSGIGRSFALRCARDGANVVVAARSKDKLDLVAEEVSAAGDKPLAVPTDVSVPDQVKALFEKVEKEFGSIDVVLNNAGLGFIGKIWQMKDEEIVKQVEINLIGEVLVAKYATAIFVKQKSGHLINTSSLAGLVPIQNWSIYCATKWGITGFTDAIRSELDDYGIRVTSVHPGLVDTPFFGQGKVEMDVSKEKSAITSDEVAEAIYDAVFTNTEKVVIPSMAKSLALLYKFFPDLTENVIENMSEKN